MSKRRSKGRASSSQEKSQEVSEDNFDVTNSAVECVRYVLLQEWTKRAIKRADIAKHLSTFKMTPANKINMVLEAANKILIQDYDNKLMQVPSKSGIVYMVISLESNPENVKRPAVDVFHRRILTAALTHIFMCGNFVTEVDMYNFLKDAGLFVEREQFTKKLLTSTFTKQLYLNYEKVGDVDPPEFAFSWGARAFEDVPKKFLLEKVSKALGKPIDFWSEQHKAAMDEEEN